KRFSYGSSYIYALELGAWERHERNCAISRLAWELILQHPERTGLLHYAQNLILSNVLHEHLLGNGRSSRTLIGQAGRGFSVNLYENRIDVKVGEQHDSFTV